MKWFTSDLHHAHKNIVKFTNRGVDTDVDHHTEWLIDVWNSQVKQGDLVYHLGDFSFARTKKEIGDFVEQLNGQKIFIKGNHDKRETLEYLDDHLLIDAWYDYKEIKIGDNAVVLFHFPIGSWHKQGKGSWHLHGHSHGNYKETRGKMLDVGIDNAYNLTGKHKFFSEDEIAEYMQKQKIFVSDSHRENI